MSQLEAFRSYNFHYDEDIDTLYGTSNGYYFIVNPVHANNRYILRFNVVNTHDDTLYESMVSLRNEFVNINDFEIKDEGASIEFELENNFNELLQSMSAVFNTNHLQQFCALGGNATHLGVYRIDNNVVILSAEKFEEYKHFHDKQYASTPQKTLRGYIGALGGIVLGSIVWIALGRIGIIASIAGILIITAAIKGFTMFGGKPLKNQLIVIVIASIVSVFVVEYISLILLIISEWGVSFNQAVKVLNFMLGNEPEIQMVFIKNLALGYVFFAIGTVRIVKEALGNSKTDSISVKLL